MGSSKKKRKKKKVDTVSPKTLKAYKQVRPVMVPLLELFAAVDDVMDEPDAFAPESIHKSLGRIYRQWMDTREALDPKFDRARYRHDMKAAAKERVKRTPLGRKQLARAQEMFSTGSTSTSEKNRKKNAKPESKSAKTSARDARSDSRVSGGLSRTKRTTESGAASRTAKGKGSGSGSTDRGTPRSRKATR